MRRVRQRTISCRLDRFANGSPAEIKREKCGLGILFNLVRSRCDPLPVYRCVYMYASVCCVVRLTLVAHRQHRSTARLRAALPRTMGNRDRTAAVVRYKQPR